MQSIIWYYAMVRLQFYGLDSVIVAWKKTTGADKCPKHSFSALCASSRLFSGLAGFVVRAVRITSYNFFALECLNYCSFCCSQRSLFRTMPSPLAMSSASAMERLHLNDWGLSNFSCAVIRARRRCETSSDIYREE